MDDLDLLRGLRASIRSNSSAFAFSVLITSTMAIRQAAVAAPSAGELFLFVVGAGLGFALLEAIASNLYRIRIREERSDVVLVGSSLAIGSMSLGLAGAWGVSELVEHPVGWLLASFTATILYVLFAALEMAFAYRAEKHNPPEKSE